MDDESEEIKRLEAVAQQLVGRVRDYDPQDNWRWFKLVLPNPADWMSLCFMLAVAVPDDRTWWELTAWTREPPKPATAQVSALRPCGTRAAYRRHLARGEQPCEACQEANRAYARDRKRVQRGAA